MEIKIRRIEEKDFDKVELLLKEVKELHRDLRQISFLQKRQNIQKKKLKI